MQAPAIPLAGCQLILNLWRGRALRLLTIY